MRGQFCNNFSRKSNRSRTWRFSFNCFVRSNHLSVHINMLSGLCRVAGERNKNVFKRPDARVNEFNAYVAYWKRSTNSNYGFRDEAIYFWKWTCNRILYSVRSHVRNIYCGERNFIQRVGYKLLFVSLLECNAFFLPLTKSSVD
jgi:hypothetical protein